MRGSFYVLESQTKAAKASQSSNHVESNQNDMKLDKKVSIYSKLL